MVSESVATSATDGAIRRLRITMQRHWSLSVMSSLWLRYDYDVGPKALSTFGRRWKYSGGSAIAMFLLEKGRASASIQRRAAYRTVRCN